MVRQKTYKIKVEYRDTDENGEEFAVSGTYMTGAPFDSGWAESVSEAFAEISDGIESDMVDCR